MAYDNAKLPNLGQLKNSMLRANGKVSDVAGSVAEALEEFAENVVAGNVRMFIGTCATAAATQAKTMTIEGLESIEEGDIFFIQFSSGQTYDGAPTLNINDLGAISIRRISGTNATKGEWVAGQVVQMVYNGNHLVIVDGGIASLTYYGKTKLSSDFDSEAENVAATPKAVKAAYDLANAANSRVVDLLGLYINERGYLCQRVASS